LSRRLGFLLVNLLWLVFSLVGAIPIFLSSRDLTLVQAIFESASAVTTTGSTVLTGLDEAPPGLLLWRSMLQWFGGIGIVALGLFVMPFLRLGGVSFFKLESSDRSEKVFARIMTFMQAFLLIYVGITVVCAITYNFLGMSQFDALNHAMTTVATGGFSTHDASFGSFSSLPLLWAAVFFMTLCSLPFSILILFLVRRKLTALKDPQILFFLSFLAVITVMLGAYNRIENGVAFEVAFAHSFFNLASILSTCGYASEDYTLWGPFAVVLVFFATFVGGCSGSTAGGMKAYRFVIMYKTLRPALSKLVYPNSVHVVRYAGVAVDANVQRAVFIFFITYLMLWVAGSAALSGMGYDLLTSTSGLVTALSNVGPGIGPLIGPAGNFATVSDPALALLSLLVIMRP
jgi:trk system potassium uptake protein TrkH